MMRTAFGDLRRATVLSQNPCRERKNSHSDPWSAFHNLQWVEWTVVTAGRKDNPLLSENLYFGEGARFGAAALRGSMSICASRPASSRFASLRSLDFHWLSVRSTKSQSWRNRRWTLIPEGFFFRRPLNLATNSFDSRKVSFGWISPSPSSFSKTGRFNWANW